VTSSEGKTHPKRLFILDDEEIEALYGRPRFTGEDRAAVFTLSQGEKDALASFTQLHVQLAFLLQLGYFKTKQLFFSFQLSDVPDDVQYLIERYFPSAAQPTLRSLNKRTILKQRQRILELFQYRICTPADRQNLFARAGQAARISSKPVYVFREVLHYLSDHRLVSPGYTVLQQHIVGKALTAEAHRLATILQTQLSSAERTALDSLFADTDGIYTITVLKRQPKDCSLKETRRELRRGEQLEPHYQFALHILPQLGISNEGVLYYASLVSYYSVFRLLQLDRDMVYLYLLCFVIHRYRRFNDNLLTCFIYLVKQYSDEARSAAKQAVTEQSRSSNNDLPKAGEVLKLFTSDEDPDTPFSLVQAKAFALLERHRLARVANYIGSEASFDEMLFYWEHIERMARRFKQNLRPIVRAINLSATRTDAPILEAIAFLKNAFANERSLSQIAQRDFPTRLLPVRDKRYMYQHGEENHKQLVPDRYEFLVYRLIRNYLEAGDLFCRTSVRFHSFEDDLLSDKQWSNKEARIAEAGLSVLSQPIREHLAELERQLEEQLVAVNKRIEAGENEHFQMSGKGKRLRWTLRYGELEEPINHPVFETLRPLNMRSLLHFVDQQCQFMTCFEHVIGRYHKQGADERVIAACLIGWGTNMGLGRMGEISDIGFDTLMRTSESFLRLETLQAANAWVSNAIAGVPIFRQYDLGGAMHSSSDGQKFETALPTFHARHSPKYFGLKKGVVANTLIANHVPINAELIGAHDHESRFVFDLLFNNTTDIQPTIHSTDTHGTNQVNFALLSVFGYQFAPRYKALREKVSTSLYGFQHPSAYGDAILKPIRKLNTDLIVEEWDNIQRIFVSLGLKTTAQHIIVGKLNAYARKNKTRQALWEYDNIISSLYLLDFVDSASLRKNVQRALNRGENYHQLRRAVSYANFGKLRFRSEEDQQVWHECSRLLTNCIIFYNTLILLELWTRKEAAGDTEGAALLTHISPVAWQHINFYGRYEFTKAVEPVNVAAIVEALAQQTITA